MSPNGSNNPNNSSSGISSITVSYTDLRCRLCGHNRSKCSVCQTPRSHSSAADRHKAKKIPKTRRKAYYCCKCKHPIELIFLLCVLAALKPKQPPNPPTACKELPRKTFEDGHGGPGSGGPSLVVFSCQIPDHGDFGALLLLQSRVQQVEANVLRLILLLSSEGPIDTGILRNTLRTLFNQLAKLTHRAFPALMPHALPNRKVFQHSLHVASRWVQVGYKNLWATALQTGMLKKSGDVLCGPNALITVFGGRSVVPSHAAEVQQLLWRSRELLDELRFWLVMLRVGGSL